MARHQLAPGRQIRNTSFVVEVDIWERYKTAAKAKGHTSRGEGIREFVQREVDEYEAAA